jgi:methylene-tetrahydrofolate reductase-like protein
VDEGRAGGPAGWPHPVRPRLAAGLNYFVHHLLVPNRVNRWFSRLIERTAWTRRLFTRAEKSVKERAFGCRMCGQCALPTTGYACPQTCPKQLRNGPCGGVAANGDCEVYPGTTCVWVIAYERSLGSGHVTDLTRLVRPLDHRLTGTSSWLNYWQGRDTDLWSEAEDVRSSPLPWPTMRTPA